MIEERMDKLREKLHLLIERKADYEEILKASQELDKCISEFTAKSIISTITSPTLTKK